MPARVGEKECLQTVQQWPEARLEAVRQLFAYAEFHAAGIRFNDDGTAEQQMGTMY
jgi:hypothetical protein